MAGKNSGSSIEGLAAEELKSEKIEEEMADKIVSVRELETVPYMTRIRDEAAQAAFSELVGNCVKVQGYDKNGPLTTNDVVVRKMAVDAIKMGNVFAEELAKAGEFGE